MIEFCLVSFKGVVLPKEDERTYSTQGEYAWLNIGILPKEDGRTYPTQGGYVDLVLNSLTHSQTTGNPMP